jgi:hypothetical protein
MSKDTIPYGWEIIDAPEYAFRPTKESAEKAIEILSKKLSSPSWEFSYVYSQEINGGKGSFIIINKMHPLDLAEYDKYLASKEKKAKRIEEEKDRKKKKSIKPKSKRKVVKKPVKKCRCKK